MTLEKKLIPIFRKKLNQSINQGVLRILILVFYGIEIYMLCLIFHSNNWYRQLPNTYDYTIFWLIIVLIVIPLIYWTVIRLFVWIYDGFLNKGNS